MSKNQTKQNEVTQQEAQSENAQPSKQGSRKLGQGALGAAFRQGFSELTNALKAFPDSLPLIEQPGQINNVPPAGVSQQAGFTSPPGAYKKQSVSSIENPTHTQHKQEEMVTSHGKATTESPGVLSQLRDEIKANLPAPEVDQELSK